ncbi:deoxynucleoside triphosphate triphosphohydrolase SAMHD1-like isoform X2 [Mytilus californianus]|uniref:deoxynucleoside triphosphate triphosphohydrolase SAMHD1-like isoform X2 n=1 Tax=Mytilus californianus TaxID=6549 RepID=UPI0022453588|nr:deoxynucleoside triphosphate triphosphohydrolase SAMHD1-like isoform X2 [Mytilus californianus]
MSKILNDSIHGTITLDPLLVKIIDTPQFQRLRNIKQLGGCYFVYPSASHNRFEHSIGTCFLASKLAHQLQQRLDQDIENLKKSNDTAKETYAMKLENAKMTKNDLLCIEIAGLCHDIGHGPYSHLFDRLFNKEMKRKYKDTMEWTHEDVSKRMLNYMITSNKDLEKELQNRFGADWMKTEEFIIDLIDGNKHKEKDTARSYMYEIVANKRNEIDVDKMDYFARDCHGLGMKSTFDHLRFISQCRVMFLRDTSNETTIAVRDKEEYNLYELFHTRIGLFRRAYYHNVTKAIEIMGKVIYVKMSEAWRHPKVYEKLTDSIFDEILVNKKPKLKKAQKLIKNVYKRKLYSLVDESSPKKKIKDEKENMEKFLKTKLREKDFSVQKVTYSYGMGSDNPITSVYFYKKDNDTDCFRRTNPKKTSLFLPETFQEEILRIYSKNKKTISLLKEETTKCFRRVKLDSVHKADIESSPGIVTRRRRETR